MPLYIMCFICNNLLRDYFYGGEGVSGGVSCVSVIYYLRVSYRYLDSVTKEHYLKTEFFLLEELN